MRFSAGRQLLEPLTRPYLAAAKSEQAGDREVARDYYQRFVDHWGDGDIDRDHVEHARQFIRSSS